jgi:hypothetical protein
MKSRPEIVAEDALLAAKGNVTVAEAKLIQALLKDQQLLIEAVAPYLKPIALKLLQRAQPKLPAAKPSETGLALKAIAEAPGYNPMMAERAGPRSEASARHVAAMQLLAAAYRRDKEKA